MASGMTVEFRNTRKNLDIAPTDGKDDDDTFMFDVYDIEFDQKGNAMIAQIDVYRNNRVDCRSVKVTDIKRINWNHHQIGHELVTP